MIAAPRARIIATGDSKPALPSYVRLQFDEVRGKHVAMAPEKLYWPDEIGVAILTRCDGTISVTEIAALLAKDYEAPQEVIFNDVLEFVQEWSDKLLLNI